MLRHQLRAAQFGSAGSSRSDGFAEKGGRSGSVLRPDRGSVDSGNRLCWSADAGRTAARTGHGSPVDHSPVRGYRSIVRMRARRQRSWAAQTIFGLRKSAVSSSVARYPGMLTVVSHRTFVLQDGYADCVAFSSSGCSRRRKHPAVKIPRGRRLGFAFCYTKRLAAAVSAGTNLLGKARFDRRRAEQRNRQNT
jgi:hypothetical protein